MKIKVGVSMLFSFCLIVALIAAHDVWTVPLGVGVSKVVKFGPLPVKIALAVQWMPIHPDTFGQKWNTQISASPVIPKLIKSTLF